MDKKLTLKLNQNIIAQAKEYASEHNISLSSLIENYLEALTTESGREEKITPLVKSLTGVINLDPDEDYKKSYTQYLGEKYK